MKGSPRTHSSSTYPHSSALAVCAWPQIEFRPRPMRFAKTNKPNKINSKAFCARVMLQPARCVLCARAGRARLIWRKGAIKRLPTRQRSSSRDPRLIVYRCEAKVFNFFCCNFILFFFQRNGSPYRIAAGGEGDDLCPRRERTSFLQRDDVEIFSLLIGVRVSLDGR